MKAKKFFIAGVQHREGWQACVKKLEVGNEIDLVPEPENKFDSNAIKVVVDDFHLGYVPKKFSAEICAAFEIEPLFCVVSTLNKSAKPWEAVEVEVKSDEELDEDEEEIEADDLEEEEEEETE